MPEDTDQDIIVNHSKFPFPPPYDQKEFESRFRIENIQVGEIEHNNSHFFITKFPDADGNSIYIPRFIPKDEKGLNDPISDEYKEFGSDRVTEGTLDDESKERLEYSLETLKLPLVLAVHLAMNRKDIDLSDFKVPDKDVLGTSMVSFYGKSGIGKTELVTMLAFYCDAPYIDFDPFSRDSVENNLKVINASGYTKDTNIDTVDMLWRSKRVVKSIRNGNGSNIDVKLRPASEILDNQLEKLKGGDRPPLIICDMPGHPDFLLHNVPRLNDIFDVMSAQSFEEEFYVKGRFMHFTNRLALHELEFYVSHYKHYLENASAGGDYLRQKVVECLNN